MKLLSKNPIFEKHKIQISEAIDNTSGIVAANGKSLYREMLLAAEELDGLLDPAKGSKPDPHIVTVKRDEFHKRCRDMGTWLEEHVPDLKLTWA
jgi:hypothetical protein